MAGEREVQRKKYPPEMSYIRILKEMIRLDIGFHALMAILLVTGLIIDLLGPWLGGWFSPIRQILHGYIGAIFVLVFVVYLVSVAYSKKMRMTLTVTNYVDFLFYVVLIVTGIAVASPNKPWVDLFPGLPNTLSPLVPYAPTIHTAVTYVWIVFATVFPGGMLHGLACTYLIEHIRRRNQK